MITTSASDDPEPVTLGTWPTPLEPMPRLAQELGLGADDLALDALFGATVVWAGAIHGDALSAAAAEVAARLRADGPVPALIPFGGSSALGARGYSVCGRELLAQAPDLDTVVVGLGSGGTMAGLVHALGTDGVMGVHCGAVTDPAGIVSAFVSDLSGTAHTPDSLRLRADQVGEATAR
ncbi:pyridoxal-phosphate dependent enzyme [Streptomyces sp. Z423-1]|uniref:pyridoxal-phosphate dependent enzyme n=2 Tax=Streptomyces TaxID=1883 RepID=UPI001F0EF40A|nr:pyridoxal-phosphate dependent enzyme [Streptomyces sp. Z423-1]